MKEPQDGIYYSPKHDELVIIKRVQMEMFGTPAKFDVQGRFFNLQQVQAVKIAPEEDDEVERIGDL